MYFYAEIMCSPPLNVSHSEIELNGTFYQDNVTYTCVTGYELSSGSLVRTCGLDKEWSGDPPICDGMTSNYYFDINITQV